MVKKGVFKQSHTSSLADEAMIEQKKIKKDTNV